MLCASHRMNTTTERYVTHRQISVFRSDAEAIVSTIAIHAVPDPRIIDVSFNQGRIWRNTGLTPFRVDLDPTGKLLKSGMIDAQGDWNNLDFVEDHSYDMIVFDPPHISDSGRKNGIAGAENWGERFGTAVDSVHDRTKKNVSHLFAPFLQEAKRILVPDSGIVLAKLSDQTHDLRYQWQHADLRDAAIEAEMTPCDLGLTVSMSRAGFNDPRWKYVRHFRKVHTFWLVIRNGKDACDPPYAPLVMRYKDTPMFSEVA